MFSTAGSSSIARAACCCSVGHAREADTSRALSHAHLQLAGVLRREQALGDHDVEQHGQHEGARARPAASMRLVVEHPVSAAVVAVDRPSRRTAWNVGAEAAAASRLGALEPARRHHRHQRQRDHRRDQDRDRQRHRELAEQPADDVAHEQQRDQHRDQRDGQRDDREADLRRALQRGLPSASRPPRCSARCSRSSRSRRRRRSRWRWSAPSGSGC